jgi:hypothetical protein
MATSTVISQRELQRVASLAYEGETLNVMLCGLGFSGFTENNTVAEWQTVEVTGNGYARYSEVIQVGSYNTTTGRYEIPAINAEFTCTSLAYEYDRVVLYVEGATYPHSVLAEDPNVILSAGQVQTYRLNVSVDD